MLTDKFLNVLKQANMARLPEFKNSKGEPAHSKPDGSDWSPAQWLQATVGELGEYAGVRDGFEFAQINQPRFAEFRLEAGKELADTLTYLSILATQIRVDLSIPPVTDSAAHRRCGSPAQFLQTTLRELGDYANTRKKYDRGDIEEVEFYQIAAAKLSNVAYWLDQLALQVGVDLTAATIDKFNEVSRRVGSCIFMLEDGTGWYYLDAPPQAVEQ